MMEISMAVIIAGWIAALFLFAPISVPARHRFLSSRNEEFDSTTSAPEMRISCIIPARNEETRIATLLDSLATQTCSPYEVIVVDDDSSDNTASLARSLGARVIAAGPRPDGWAGKPWACQQGANAATGDICVFLDADVFLAPEALYGIRRTLKPGSIVSIQPFHMAPTMTEKLSALFNLQSAASVGFGTAGPVGTAGEPARKSGENRGLRRISEWVEQVLRRPPTGGLFGPVIAVHAGDYEAFGGHRKVSASILEDVHLGQVAREAGLTVQTWLGSEHVRFRMYPDGFRSLLDGWTKNLVAGAQSTSPLTLVLQILFISGAATTGAQAALALFGNSVLSPAAAFIAYAAYTGLLAVVLPAHGSFRSVTAALFPLHVLFYFAVCQRALAFQFAHQEVRWRGRKIAAQQSSQNKPSRRISTNRA